MILAVPINCVYASDESLKETVESAEQGDANAQYLLWSKHLEGNGLPQDYKEAEKLLKERLNIKIIPQLYVELGYNYSLQENDSLATINYDKAILFVNESKKFNYGRSIGESFERYSLLNYAIETYIIAMNTFPDTDFSYQLARLYGEQGNLEKMFEEYKEMVWTINF